MDTNNQNTGQLTGKRVLCIEDEHFISELYDRALTRGGYAVEFEIDGKLGLEKALTNTFDVILLDLMVPTIDGIQILHQLRDPALQPPLKAKVIIITNLEQRDDIRREIEKQADGYIVKADITPRELVEVLNKLAL